MRLFVATTFPQDVLATLQERVAPIKPRLPPASWVRPDSQHLTLLFLGEQPESIVAPLKRTLDESLAGQAAFEGHLEGCGFFPNSRHARVGWVGVEPKEHFTRLAAAVSSAAEEAGIPHDQREFQPHLTMMRIRDGWPPLSTRMFCSAYDQYRSPDLLINRVTLFSSQLKPSGAVHTSLREFTLGA